MVEKTWENSPKWPWNEETPVLNQRAKWLATFCSLNFQTSKRMTMESHGIPWNPGISRIACRVLAACNGLMVSSAPNGCGKTDWWMVAEWCGFRRDTFQVWGFIQDAYLVHPCSAKNRERDCEQRWPVGSNMFQQSQKTCLVNLGHHGIIVGSRVDIIRCGHFDLRHSR